MITQNFDLNLIPDSSPVVIHCDQYDKGTGRLVVSLYIDAISYSPSGTAIIQGIKPDNKGFAYDASMSGNVVTADLTEQMTAVAGRVRCQIVVTESTGRTGTFVFILDVQKSALPADSDMSESDYQLIEEAIEETRQAAFDAEAWAVGERGGIPVSSDDPTYHNNAEYWANVAAQYAQGGLKYKGSVLFANIPTTGMVEGDMYNIEDDFVTDSRFQEGAGKSAQAGTNIAWNSNNKWDLLAVAVIPTMTTSVMGIGKPDGITTGVNNGTFFAKGVTIVADVNSGGTQYGSNWLYYHGTTDVITPDIETEYRVTENGDTSLYYWTGTAYEQLTSAGSGVDFVGLLGSTEITSTKPDLNSYTNIGTYYRTDTSFNVSNYPVGISATDRFLLIVQKTTNNSNTIIQSYLGEGGFSQRSSSNGGTSWSSWTRYANYDDVKDVFYLKGVYTIANSSTDLDICTSLTSYRKSLTTFVPLHAPSDIVATDRFLLYNLRVSGSTTSSEPTVQLIYSISSDGTTNMYTRGRVSSSDSWSAWKKAGEGSGGGGDYVGLYGMTEIQSSDGQGTTLIDLDQYATVGNYYCDGKGAIKLSYFSIARTTNASITTYNDAYFLMYVRKVGTDTIIQDLYRRYGGGEETYVMHYMRTAQYTNNNWDFKRWRLDILTGPEVANIITRSLGDVSTTNLANGDLFRYNATSFKWENAPKSLYPSAPITTWADYQQLVENDEDDPDAEYYVDDIDVAEAYYVETSGQTALTGATSLTFTNSHITPTSDIRILAEPASCKVSTNPQYKVSAKLGSVGNGTATITFPALAENTTFWLLIECPLAITVDPAYVYNTDETVIGEFLGNTLYRKVITGTLSSPYSFAHNIANLGTVVRLEGYAKSASTTRNLNFSYFGDASWDSALTINATYIIIEAGSSYLNAHTGYTFTVTIEYTKTTD